MIKNKICLFFIIKLFIEIDRSIYCEKNNKLQSFYELKGLTNHLNRECGDLVIIM